MEVTPSAKKQPAVVVALLDRPDEKDESLCRSRTHRPDETDPGHWPGVEIMEYWLNVLKGLKTGCYGTHKPVPEATRQLLSSEIEQSMARWSARLPGYENQAEYHKTKRYIIEIWEELALRCGLPVDLRRANNSPIAQKIQEANESKPEDPENVSDTKATYNEAGKKHDVGAGNQGLDGTQPPLGTLPKPPMLGDIAFTESLPEMTSGGRRRERAPMLGAISKSSRAQSLPNTAPPAQRQLDTHKTVPTTISAIPDSTGADRPASPNVL